MFQECVHEQISELDRCCLQCGLHFGPTLDFDQHHYGRGSYNYRRNVDIIEKTQLPMNVQNHLRHAIAASGSNYTRRETVASAVVVSAQNGIDPECFTRHMPSRMKNYILRVASGTDSSGESNMQTCMPVCSLPPSGYVESILKTLVQAGCSSDLVLHQTAIQSLIAKCIEASPTLIDIRPQPLAITFVRFYFRSNSIRIPELEIKLKTTKAAVDQYRQKVKLAVDRVYPNYPTM